MCSAVCAARASPAARRSSWSRPATAGTTGSSRCPTDGWSWASRPPATTASATRAGRGRSSPSGRTEATYGCMPAGIRAPFGVAYDSASGGLLTSMNQRDDLGDRTPGDWLALVRAGQRWRFPGCYGQGGSACRGVPAPLAVLDKHAAAGGVAVVAGRARGRRRPRCARERVGARARSRSVVAEGRRRLRESTSEDAPRGLRESAAPRGRAGRRPARRRLEARDRLPRRAWLAVPSPGRRSAS